MQLKKRNKLSSRADCVDEFISQFGYWSDVIGGMCIASFAAHVVGLIVSHAFTLAYFKLPTVTPSSPTSECLSLVAKARWGIMTLPSSAIWAKASTSGAWNIFPKSTERNTSMISAVHFKVKQHRSISSWIYHRSHSNSTNVSSWAFGSNEHRILASIHPGEGRILTNDTRIQWLMDDAEKAILICLNSLVALLPHWYCTLVDHWLSTKFSNR